MTLRPLQGLPVLCYHRIVDGEASGRYDLPVPAFRQQLRLIQDHKVAVVLPEQIAAGGAPDGSAALTFDDGCDSDYRLAFPLLSEFGVSATFFVNTASVGNEGFLNWQMAAEMSRSGMRFGSHAHNHIALTMLSPDRLRKELLVSKEILEQRLSTGVSVMAVPYGFCSQAVIEVAWELGYHVVCTSKPWPAQNGRRVLSRAAVLHDTATEEFRKLLEKDPEIYMRRWIRDCALAIPKTILLRLRPSLLGVRTAESAL